MAMYEYPDNPSPEEVKAGAVRKYHRDRMIASAVSSALGLLYLTVGVLTASVSYHMSPSYWSVAWVWFWPIAWAKWIWLHQVTLTTLSDWFSRFLL
jgi:VanZ family protein